MSVKTPSADENGAVDQAASEPGDATPPDDPQWIDWLFRDSLRRQQRSPLMELMRLYRKRDES
jgi:hypothetical protein